MINRVEPVSPIPNHKRKEKHGEDTFRFNLQAELIKRKRGVVIATIYKTS